MEAIEISVIVPVFRSEQTLRMLTQRTHDTLHPIYGNAFEILFVEDHGGDASWNVIENIKKEFPQTVFGIKLSKNFGQHNALMCGMNYARGKFVVTIDDDLQIPPEEILKLIHKQKESNADLVYGIYGKKQHHQVRNLGSTVIKQVFKWVFDAKPDGTSFRIITADLVKKLIEHKQSHVFLEGYIHWHTKNIAYQEVVHKEREFGTSTYTARKLISLTMSLFFNFTVLPLRLITYMGFVFSVVAMIWALQIIYVKITQDIPVQGYSSLATIILFSSSMLMISMGVVGEYIARIFMNQNSKPQYSIEKRI